MTDATTQTTIPAGPFSTVVADPPWQPTLGATWESRLRDKAGPQRFYDTLSVEQIIANKPPLAAQAHVYIWCLTAHVDWGYQVAAAWGAEPITLLTWKKPGLGAGRFRCNTEHVLVARVGPRAGNPFGQGGRSAQATAGTLFEWPRGRHSEKPREACRKIWKERWRYAMSDPQTTEGPPELTLYVFARLVANLYRKEADDHEITIGDWSPSPVPGRSPLFHGSIRLTVGHFRSWAPDHVREYAN